MNDLIEKVSEQLRERYPKVQFRIDNNDELRILPKGENGFEIFVQQGETENTLHFGTWHFHFENNKKGKHALLDCIVYGMSKLGRLKAYLRVGKEYKWTFETLNEEDGNWYSAGTMRLMNFKFWQKSTNKYYQNNLIEIEGQKK